MFWNKKIRHEQIKGMHDEAEILKTDAIQETRKASAEVRRLNKLLINNGITIRIHKVAGGGHSGR